jgi:CRISPR/Cas system CSM-associated protein Csm4 (group 5 of RAMP superfamily)
MARLKQYVNLQAISLLVERGITSIDRLGAVTFKVEVKKDDPMIVKFRTVLVSEKSPYTEAEKTRNRWYKVVEPLGIGLTEGKKSEAECVAILPPSGGAIYKIEACGDGKTIKSSDEIETWRRLFIQVFRMKDASDAKKCAKVPNLKDSIDY